MTNDSGKGRRYGQTYAEVEYLLHSGGDKGLAWNTLRKIRAAEKRHGFETGARFKIVDGRPVQHRISVMFYPKPLSGSRKPCLTGASEPPGPWRSPNTTRRSG